MSQETPILIVDDSTSMRMALRQMLKDAGYKDIKVAQDGLEGIKCLKESLGKCAQKIGLILCDWTMPNMTGIEMLETIRKVNDFKTTPFIMVTNEKRTERILKAIQTGANDFIVKPFPPDLLLEKVKKLLVAGR